MTDPAPDYVRILDSLHGIEIPFYTAVQIHDAVDETCETDTYLVVTMSDGTVWEVAQVTVRDWSGFATLQLNDHPKVQEIEDLIYEKTLPHPEGVYVHLHAQVSVRISDIVKCHLERS